MDPRHARWASDGVLAVGLAALGVVEALVPFSTVTGSGSDGAAATLAATSGLALALRRRFPLAVVAVQILPWGVAALLLEVPVVFWGALAPLAIATYSASRYGRRRTPVTALAIAAAGMLMFNIGTGMIKRPGELFFPWLVLGTTWLAGWIIHRKESGAAASERRAREAETLSRERTLAALAEERARIARELHDVVAHAVTAMVVQAGAAEEVAASDPAYVRDSLDRIRRTGSEALDEMRRVVSLLRETDEHQPLSPQPGLADLAALIERSGSASTAIDLRIEGERRPLPLGADLAAYRIVQEALTNLHRHAAATEATVTVRYDTDSVTFEITDNGTGPAVGAAQRGSGNGLIGMRERAEMYGGRLDAGGAPDGGFRVRATLPLEALPIEGVRS